MATRILYAIWAFGIFREKANLIARQKQIFARHNSSQPSTWAMTVGEILDEVVVVVPAVAVTATHVRPMA
jgi:hypothetical protein